METTAEQVGRAAFYKAEVLPLLAKVALMLAEQGISFLFSVELDNADDGSQRYAGISSIGEDCSETLRAATAICEGRALAIPVSAPEEVSPALSEMLRAMEQGMTAH